MNTLPFLSFFLRYKYSQLNDELLCFLAGILSDMGSSNLLLKLFSLFVIYMTLCVGRNVVYGKMNIVHTLRLQYTTLYNLY